MAFVFHRDHVSELPQECEQTFTSGGCRVEGFSHTRLPVQAVQFHPEIPRSQAAKILARWTAEKGDSGAVVGYISTFDARAGHAVLAKLIDSCLDARRLAR